MKKLFLVVLIALGWSLTPCAQGQTVTSLPDSPTLAAPAPNANGSGSGSGFIMDRDPDEPGHFQVAFNYAWMHFEATPATKLNLNGLDASLTYYIKGIGLEGQIMGEWGSNLSKVGFAGGGVHYRWEDRSKLQPWAHVLVGYAHVYPQEPFGKVTSFAWEGGGGVDYRLRSWLYARGGANAFGTRLFGTNQVSAQVIAGLVVEF